MNGRIEIAVRRLVYAEQTKIFQCCSRMVLIAQSIIKNTNISLLYSLAIVNNSLDSIALILFFY